MFKFFEVIIELLGIIGSFITNLVTSIVYVFQFIGNGVAYMAVCLAQLPAFVYAPVVAIISYAVIINILNKGN